MTADWRLAILLIADDAVPAAERLKNVAPGVSPGYACRETPSPGRGERLCAASFAPTGLVQHQHEPRACARGYVLKPLRGHERSECKPDRGAAIRKCSTKIT